MTARDLAATVREAEALVEQAKKWSEDIASPYWPGLTESDWSQLTFAIAETLESLMSHVAALERQAADAQEEMARIIRDDGLVVTRVRERAERAEESLRKIARYNVATRQAMELRRIAREALAAAGEVMLPGPS